MAKHKNIPVTQTINDALGEIGELEELHEEMETWQSNLESNSMEHLPKYEEVQEAVNVLERKDDLAQATQELLSELKSYVVTCDECGSTASLLDTEIEYVLMEPYKGRSEPRWMRLANSLAPYRAVVEFLGEVDGLVRVDPFTELDNAVKTIILDFTQGSKHTKLVAALIKFRDEQKPKAVEEEEEEEEVEIDCSELENWCDELDATEFPGMFG